ncbi:MAG: CDP-6-deoxy-delta-3,4-glucoseen reductase [Gallionella sp.]
MTFSITLQPANRSFPIEANETILNAALKHGYALPYSCREGSCGVCKGRVLQGSVDHGNFLGSILSAAERAEGMALFCCATPESDLVIEYRETNPTRDITVRILPCRVEKMQRVADDVMVLYLRLPDSERLQFIAGQYIDILKGSGKQHSFSLGNAPHDNELLQLHIRMVPGGDFTHHVFTQMKEGDILRIKGPLGACYLRDSAKPAIFIASGTCIAQVKAIIEHALHAGIKRPMHLYWGARKLADFYLLDRVKQWEAQGVRFTPVLSEPLPEDHWQGKTGFVHQAVMEDYGDLSGHQVYACGGPVMINAAHQDFTTLRGLPGEEFFSDSLAPQAPSKILKPD